MRYQILAVDYDGTLAREGHVDAETVEALHRLRASGRRIVLVTGRRLEPLLAIFPELALCDLVVAENGALLYEPGSGRVRTLADPPPPEFAESLRTRGVAPFEVGHVIVATWTPHEVAVLEAVRDLELDLQIIFNKGAVMVLPAGITKATGLAAVLEELSVDPANCVAVGDAENDEAMLRMCGASAAVANALDPVKELADIVLAKERGAGVAELIERLIADDLAGVGKAPDLTRPAGQAPA